MAKPPAEHSTFPQSGTFERFILGSFLHSERLGLSSVSFLFPHNLIEVGDHCHLPGFAAAWLLPTQKQSLRYLVERLCARMRRNVSRDRGVPRFVASQRFNLYIAILQKKLPPHSIPECRQAASSIPPEDIEDTVISSSRRYSSIEVGPSSQVSFFLLLRVNYCGMGRSCSS